MSFVRGSNCLCTWSNLRMASGPLTSGTVERKVNARERPHRFVNSERSLI